MKDFFKKLGLTIACISRNAKFSRASKTFLIKMENSHQASTIRSNHKKVLSRLRKEVKNRKLKVVFLVQENQKWKCDSLYNELINEKHFEVKFLVTQTLQIHSGKNDKTVRIEEHYEFYKKKYPDVDYAYDIEKKKYLDLKSFKPDIVIYEQPYDLGEKQSLVAVSKYALTYYIPYFLPDIKSEIEYSYAFHSDVHKFYVMNEECKNYYTPLMRSRGKNLVPVGNPQLDYFYLNKKSENEKKYGEKFVIYAPHHSIDDTRLNLATFEWNGDFMLEYAKNHPEINWVFKPHPYLKYVLFAKKIMTEEQINEYWREWEKVSIVHQKGDYLDLFMNSQALITDCGSFVVEYFLTEKPVIHLVSKKAVPRHDYVNEILQTYYRVLDTKELKDNMDKLLIKKEDTMKEERLHLLKKSALNQNYAAKNILEDIKAELGIN